jgi:hypothetical protein
MFFEKDFLKTGLELGGTRARANNYIIFGIRRY